jgi:hypothetical protein
MSEKQPGSCNQSLMTQSQLAEAVKLSTRSIDNGCRDVAATIAKPISDSSRLVAMQTCVNGGDQ